MLSAAVVSGFECQSVVNDDAEDCCRQDKQQQVVNGVFHGVVWVVGWPGRPGCVNGSGYLGGVNPENSAVAICDVDTASSVNVLPPLPWITKHGIG